MSRQTNDQREPVSLIPLIEANERLVQSIAELERTGGRLEAERDQARAEASRLADELRATRANLETVNALFRDLQTVEATQHANTLADDQPDTTPTNEPKEPPETRLGYIAALLVAAMIVGGGVLLWVVWYA